MSNIAGEEILRDALAESSSVALVAEDFSPGSPADTEARGLLFAGFTVIPMPLFPGQHPWILPFGTRTASLGSVDIICLLSAGKSLPSAAEKVRSLQRKPRLLWLQGKKAPDSWAALHGIDVPMAEGDSLAAVNAALFDGTSQFFTCRRCGKCCEGRGGIVVSPRDLTRLSVFLGLSGQDVLSRFTEQMRGQPVIRCGSDGYCVFFREGAGCVIHPARPAVCRAWPFFRGNLVDHVSFAMAREDCPGISRRCSHEDFAWEGYRYLRAYKLLAHDMRTEGRMLLVDEKDLPLTER